VETPKWETTLESTTKRINEGKTRGNRVILKKLQRLQVKRSERRQRKSNKCLKNYLASFHIETIF